MNKKGFTLVEILAVIVIIALLSVLGISGARGISNRIKQKEYDAKVETLKSAALDYAEGYYSNLKNGTTGYKMTKIGTTEKLSCMNVTIQDLYLAGYLKGEIVKNCTNINCVIGDPRSDGAYLHSVLVYYFNNKINVFYDKESATYSTPCIEGA